MKLLSKTISLTLGLVFAIVSFMPQYAAAQISSLEPQPPRAPNVEPGALQSIDLEDTNVGASLVTGGAFAIDECVDQPLGEFSGILSSNMTAMATEFLGGAGVVDEVSNAVATATNIANAALGLAQVGAKLGPLIGLPPGIGDFLGGAEKTQDDRTFNAILQSSTELTKLNAKIGEVQARGTSDILGVLQNMQVSDNCLDRVVFIQAQNLLFDMRNQASEWIVSGFEGGNPGFVQNIEQRERNLAAAQWLNFLDPDQGSFSGICSAFREDVVFNVRQAYNRSFGGDPAQVIPEVDLSTTEELLLRRAVTDDEGDGCALNQITGSEENTQRFLDGEFVTGSWEGWFTLFNDPNSNPNTASRVYTQQLNNSIQSEWDADRRRLAYSGGYLDDRRCIDENGNASEVGFAGICADGSDPITVTPGSAVAAVIEGLAQADIDRAVMVDKVGEVVESIGMTLIGQLFPTGSQSRAPGLANLSAQSFEQAFAQAYENTANFAGPNPDSFSIAMLDRQVSTEEAMYSMFSDIWELRNSQGFTDVEQCIEGNSNLQTSLQELDALIESIIPGSQSSLEAKYDYEPPGQYKVDWAGNDFEWLEEKVYGLETCEIDTYGDYETEIDQLLERFIDRPQFSFRMPTDGDSWQISICAPLGDGGRTQFFKIGYSPPGYREANNNLKVDWNGLPFNWKRYDPFQKENAYEIRQCDTRTEGEFGYSAGQRLSTDDVRGPSSSDWSAIYPIDGNERKGVRNWCVYFGHLLGFAECTGDNQDPESREQISIGMSRGLEYLLGTKLNYSVNGSGLLEINNSNWYRNRCALEGIGDVEGGKIYAAYKGYYDQSTQGSAAYSPQPKPTSLDVLLANIAVTLDGLPDLIAPQSIIDEVRPAGAADRAAIENGLYDLRQQFNSGTPSSLVAQSFYELAQNRNFHSREDVEIARSGYEQILNLYELILEQSEDCQTTPGGGVTDILADGDIAVDGINTYQDEIDLPNDYEQPITISWETEYCDPNIGVYVYRNGVEIASGLSGSELDDTLVGVDATAVYELYCGRPDETIGRQARSTDDGSYNQSNRNRGLVAQLWTMILPTAQAQVNSQSSNNKARLLDYVIVDSNLSAGSAGNNPGTIAQSSGVLTINGRNNNFSIDSSRADLNISWVTDQCPTDLNLYRDAINLYSGEADSEYRDNRIGSPDTYRYELYCGQRQPHSRADRASGSSTTTNVNGQVISKLLDSIRVSVIDDTDPVVIEDDDTNDPAVGDDNESADDQTGDSPEPNGIDDDGDGCIDDTSLDSDGQCDNGGAYNAPEENTANNLDDDSDGCIDDSYLDPDGSCNDGGDYTRGEDETDLDESANNINAVALTNGIDDDGDGLIDEDDEASLPITDLSNLGQVENEDESPIIWWLWLLILLLIILIGYFLYRLIRSRRNKNQVIEINAANAARQTEVTVPTPAKN